MCECVVREWLSVYLPKYRCKSLPIIPLFLLLGVVVFFLKLFDAPHLSLYPQFYLSPNKITTTQMSVSVFAMHAIFARTAK